MEIDLCSNVMMVITKMGMDAQGIVKSNLDINVLEVHPIIRIHAIHLDRKELLSKELVKLGNQQVLY